MHADELVRAMHELAERQPPVDAVAGRAGVERRRRRHQQVRALATAACLLVACLVGWSLTSGDDDRAVDVVDEPSPGMLVPDLAPGQGVVARTTGADEPAARPGEPIVRTWVWTSPAGRAVPDHQPRAGDDAVLHRPVVWLAVFAAPGGQAFAPEPFETMPMPGGLTAWQQAWPEARAAVVARSIDAPRAGALLSALPANGWDGSAVAPPDGLVALLEDVAVEEPVPGIVVPVTDGHPLQHLRVARPDGSTLTVAAGDPRTTTLAWLIQDTDDPPVLGQVHGEPAWSLTPGMASGTDLRVVLWTEGGRGYALALTDAGGRSLGDDELFAAAEALRPVGAAEWQALVQRTSGGGTVDTVTATVEGQGAPVDPVTGEPLP